MINNKATTSQMPNYFNSYNAKRRYSDSEQMKASANSTLFKANKSFSNLAATSISCVEKQETYTRRDSFDIGQVAGGAVNKVFGQIQEAISRVLNKNNMDMESATFDDLIKTIESRVIYP